MSGAAPATGIAEILAAPGSSARPSRAVPPGSVAELSCQKIIFDLQLADLPVQKIDPRFREGRLWASLVAPSADAPPSKTLTAPSNSCFFQLWIWFGWTPKCIASSATVRSPLIAASATFALNAALCFCRVRFIFLLPRYPRFLGAGLHVSYLSHFRGPAQYSVPANRPVEGRK